MKLYQNASGYAVEINITDQNGPVDLTGAIVKLVLSIPAKAFRSEKTATILDATIGKCEVVLSKNETAIIGECFLQTVVSFDDNNIFPSDLSKVKIENVL